MQTGACTPWTNRRRTTSDGRMTVLVGQLGLPDTWIEASMQG